MLSAEEEENSNLQHNRTKHTIQQSDASNQSRWDESIFTISYSRAMNLELKHTSISIQKHQIRINSYSHLIRICSSVANGFRYGDQHLQIGMETQSNFPGTWKPKSYIHSTSRSTAKIGQCFPITSCQVVLDCTWNQQILSLYQTNKSILS